MAILNIPNVGPTCDKCRFRVYSEFERAGNNVTHCELFMKSFEEKITECPYNINEDEEIEDDE